MNDPPTDWLIRPASRCTIRTVEFSQIEHGSSVFIVSDQRPARHYTYQHLHGDHKPAASCSMLTAGCLDCNPQDRRIERLAADYKCPREADAGSLKDRLRLEFKKRLTEQAAGDKTAPDARCCKFWT